MIGEQNLEVKILPGYPTDLRYQALFIKRALMKKYFHKVPSCTYNFEIVLF